jgi:hypothetical protein
MSDVDLLNFALDLDCPQCGGEHIAAVAAGTLLPCFAWARVATDDDETEAETDRLKRGRAAKECA